jgi:hypothetical protein
MGGFQASRRRIIGAKGRPMTLRRSGHTDLSVLGTLTSYSPETIQVGGDVKQGDGKVNLLNDEIAAAGQPAPRAKDQLVIDGKTWAVMGSFPVYDAASVIGWTLWVRGGSV